MYRRENPDDPPPEALEMATFITNYLASVWFSWLTHIHRYHDEEYLLNFEYFMAGTKLMIKSLAEGNVADLLDR